MHFPIYTVKVMHANIIVDINIFHVFVFMKMAYELHAMLTGAVSLTTWEKVVPAYGGESESFLNNVVTPIYSVIRKVLLLDFTLSVYIPV
jgi:hypothetical protein